MILCGDIGATKILLEVGDFRNGRWTAAFARRYPTAEAGSFSAVVERFIEEWKPESPARARITAAGFGAAGPALGNKVKMTHRPLVIDADAIGRRFGFATSRVVNDLEAMAHGLDLVAPRELVTIQPGRADPGRPRVVIGVGTGLGIAYSLPLGGGLGRGFQVIGGEGGHVGFAPASAAQREVAEALGHGRPHLECEDVVSGVGYEALARYCEGDENRALELFAECLGNVAGDHALAVLALGGVYLAGGVIAKTIEKLPRDRLRSAFCAKSARAGFLMKIPVKAVLNERVAVLGAARLVM